MWNTDIHAGKIPDIEKQKTNPLNPTTKNIKDSQNLCNFSKIYACYKNIKDSQNLYNFSKKFLILLPKKKLDKVCQVYITCLKP